MFTDDRQALWWSLVAGSFFWYLREAGSPCDGPWWLVLHWGCGELWLRWYCAGGLWGALASLVLCWGLWGALALLVLCWGAVGSPSFAGTVLGLWGALASLVLCWGGGCGEPWLCWYCAGGLWGALASLVLCWGAGGSPGFAGTVLGGCGEPWLHWYCAGGLWGALASLVLCWGAVGSPGFAGTVLEAVGSPGFSVTLLGGCGELWLRWET